MPNDIQGNSLVDEPEIPSSSRGERRAGMEPKAHDTEGQPESDAVPTQRSGEQCPKDDIAAAQRPPDDS